MQSLESEVDKVHVWGLHLRNSQNHELMSPAEPCSQVTTSKSYYEDQDELPSSEPVSLYALPPEDIADVILP